MSKKYRVVNVGTGEDAAYFDLIEFDTLDELEEIDRNTVFGCVALDGESYMSDEWFDECKEKGTLFTSIEKGLDEIDSYFDRFDAGYEEDRKELEDKKALFLKEIGDAKKGFQWGMEYDVELVVVTTGNFFELREEAKKKHQQLEDEGYYC